NSIPSSPTSGVHAFVTKIGSAATANDLSITLHHSPDPVPQFSPLTLTATIVNNGPGTASGVTVYPTIAPGGTPLQLFGFSSATSTVGTCDTTTGFCNIGTLASGAGATVTLTTTPFTGGTFVAALGVGGNESDPVPANNISTNGV